VLRGYGTAMSPRDDDLDYEDQDAEPTMTAPEEGRPDGLTALDESDQSDEGDRSDQDGGTS
jgi:hypothetical protein